jgi:hypothetical protein
MKNEMIKLTGLWREKDKDGRSYLTGSLNQISKLLILPNTYKKDGDTSPDYFLYLTQNEKKIGPSKKDSL